MRRLIWIFVQALCALNSHATFTHLVEANQFQDGATQQHTMIVNSMVLTAQSNRYAAGNCLSPHSTRYAQQNIKLNATYEAKTKEMRKWAIKSRLMTLVPRHPPTD